MKRVTPIILALLMILATGCAGGPTPGQSIPPANTDVQPQDTLAPIPGETLETIAFEDDCGRQVELPETLQTLQSQGEAARQLIYALGPDLEPEEGGATPQALLVVGEQTEETAAEMDLLQTQQGLPVVFLEGGIEALPATLRTLGGLLGQEEQAEEMAQYVELSLLELQLQAAAIPDDERKQVYWGTGSDGLTVAPGAHVSIQAAGGVPVLEQEEGKTVTLDQLAKAAPDVIFLNEGGPYAGLENDTGWNALETVQFGTFFEVPQSPFPWLEQGAISQVLGLKWMGSLLYPDAFVNDMLEETKAFYDLFWHQQLTDDEVEALLANSIFKSIG